MKPALPILLLVAVAGAAFASIAWHPAIDPAAPPPADAKPVARGAALAAQGVDRAGRNLYPALPYDHTEGSAS